MLNPDFTLLSLSYVNLCYEYEVCKQNLLKFQNHPGNVVSKVTITGVATQFGGCGMQHILVGTIIATNVK